MGVAGSGKSTQGRMLADEKGYAWISTGEILRVLVTGSRRHEMLEGKLLSDEEIIQIFDKVLDLINPADEFVIDGFPRTVPQANWLIEEKKRQNRFDITAVFHLAASENIVHDRLRERGRLDDSEQAITKRFKEYHGVTLPIIDEFKKQGVPVYDIDASKDAGTIHEEIMSHINNPK
jgi:adenylate kinase